MPGLAEGRGIRPGHPSLGADPSHDGATIAAFKPASSMATMSHYVGLHRSNIIDKFCKGECRDKRSGGKKPIKISPGIKKYIGDLHNEKYPHFLSEISLTAMVDTET
ncbi:hypothetical protein RF11_13220 [Thelohanellus kitauei]|uniref:Uncharacterized protein n=1 Tax=Thelohanellus kitauei TaxID=669202 RepID=A0A0C2MX63_THEKT|nr:hypothetical protein RF11_13220 [Thelohanellus kitauei]